MIACTIQIVFIGAPCFSSNDVTHIGALFENPQTYQLRNVTLRGRIRNVRQVVPYIGRLGPVYDPCTFTLEDATGLIEVQFGQGCPADDLDRFAATDEVFEVQGQVQNLSTSNESSKLIVVGFQIKRISK